MARMIKCLFVAVWALFGVQNTVMAAEGDAGVHHFDVVVYGSTPGGVVAAVAAAREGLKVALVDYPHHVGGMMASGLDTTDRGNVGIIGGIPLEFFQRVGKHYNAPIEFDFEPHVAEQIFNEMLQEAHVTVYLDTRLREKDGVSTKNKRITAMTMEDGAVFSAKEFIDATYEGDLMVQAGVSNTWGREASSQYHESLAGVIPSQRHDHQFVVKVSPYAADGSLLPLVSSAPKGELGQGDKKMPAYTYRMCFTDQKSNQAPYPKPDNYDPKQYELLARYLAIRVNAPGTPPLVVSNGSWGLMMGLPLRNHKFDFNSMGAISSDNIGANWDYPTASYKQRAEIAKEHYDYEAGLFYFLSHDPRVPPALQEGFNQYGLCKDEFADTNHWPWQLYVREDHRMLGEYVMTQHDEQETLTKPDSIGMGSYQIDSHNVQRVPTPDGGVENEGDMYTALPTPYEIAYRSLVPKRGEVVNLVVPVCISASHVAYSSFRQEPNFMFAGHAAGVAAAIAVKRGVNVQDVPVKELQGRLTAEHAVLHYTK